MHIFKHLFFQLNIFGGGCGSVGRAVVSNTRDPRFESSHRYYLLSTEIEKTNKERKKAENGPFKQHPFRVGTQTVVITSGKFTENVMLTVLGCDRQ